MIRPLFLAWMPCQKISSSIRKNVNCAIAKTVKTPGLRRTIHSGRHGRLSRFTQVRDSSTLG